MLPAMRQFCSTCGTATDPTRQYCARCGIFQGWKTWAAPLDARVCANCGAPNAPDRTDCGHCFRNLASGLDATCGQVYLFEHPSLIGDLPVPEPTPTVLGPLPEGACTRCGTVNPAGEAFCASCGAYLEWATAPALRQGGDNDRQG